MTLMSFGFDQLVMKSLHINWVDAMQTISGSVLRDFKLQHFDFT